MMLLVLQKLVKKQLGDKFRNKRRADPGPEVAMKKKKRPGLRNYLPPLPAERQFESIEKMKGTISADEASNNRKLPARTAGFCLAIYCRTIVSFSCH